MRLSHVSALTALFLLSPDSLSFAAQIETNDPLPEQWQYISEFSQQLPSDDVWWKAFDDPMLDSLINLGIERNYNLLQAAHRIEIARQTLCQARSQYMPSLNFSGGWNKARTSGRTMGDVGSPVTTDYFSLGVDMSWQIDIFGKITARAKQSKAQLNASRAEYTGAMVTICGNIASAYLQLRTLQAERQVAISHIESQQRVVKITEARHDAALASGLDVAQALTVFYSTQASLFSLDTSIEQTINSIAVLIGEYPAQLAETLRVEAPIPDYHQMVCVGVPMDLLRRRPDIAEAEATLASYAAALGIAKKDFLPTLSINGSIGTQAHKADDLFTRPSYTYAIASTLTWTIFDGMSRKAAVASARQQMEAGIDNYNLTLITAVQEVENAMVAYRNSLSYIEMLEKVVDEAQRTFDLSIDQYKNGLASFTTVADAQISLLQYADQLVVARGQALTGLVNLYEALGGGFNVSAN